MYLQISETGASAASWELYQGESIMGRGNEDQNLLLSPPTHRPLTKMITCGGEGRIAREKK